MGDFDFGQFQQIYQYLIDKLNDGDALTPQEQQVYDMLIGFANQGLNLTNTADFNSLYTAFNGLADDATKQQFEQQYGTGLVQNPDGTISFTRPGSVMEAFQRRGLSVNDGPAMAALSEGLRNYNQQLAQNKFASMTNAYQDMTPIRAQNISAATNAGNVASTAIGRRVPIVGGAIGGARGGSGGGEGGGEGGTDVPIPPRPPVPSLLDKLAPDLIRLLGGAGVAGAGFLLKDWWQHRNDPNKYSQDELDRAAADIVNRNQLPQGSTIENTQLGSRSENVDMNTPYQINQAAFTSGSDVNPYGSWPEAQDMSGSVYGNYGTPQAQNNWGGSYGTDYNQSYNQPSYDWSNYGDSGPVDYSNYYNDTSSWGDPYQDTAWGGSSDWSMPSYDDYSSSYDPFNDWGY